jgi:hypothetical protein
VKKLAIVTLIALVSCARSGDKYDPSKYLTNEQRKEALSGIVTYIFSAPPYTLTKDRFKPEHKYYYDSTSQRLFSLDRFYVDINKRQYYLVVRPGNSSEFKRAAGGYYDLDANNNITNFREAFVTPMVSDSVARGRGRFLFDQMVKHNLGPYLKMTTYVQWPNPISYYDSTVYEWKTNMAMQSDSTLLNPADSVDH